MWDFGVHILVQPFHFLPKTPKIIQLQHIAVPIQNGWTLKRVQKKNQKEQNKKRRRHTQKHNGKKTITHLYSYWKKPKQMADSEEYNATTKTSNSNNNAWAA